MRIPSFDVRDQRSISLAKCDVVPRLMIIAGPNGSGKSTLLNAIRRNANYTNVIYVGPHRAMRKQTVQQRHLYAQSISLETLFAAQAISSVEGIRIFEGDRDPWGYDETSNYLKHALCQIEAERSRAITSRVDREGEIKKGGVADAWKPLRDLASHLLPHLAFEKIDSTNRDKVLALFRVHRSDRLVDIDDLSSGEKSILQMFYPLIERDVKSLITDIEVGVHTDERPEICVLIDEPELHLHPNLQVKVLDYLRVLTTDRNAQVIVATHSPTIVEVASADELFLLRPVELVQPGDNQLVRVAETEEGLEAIRSLFGSTNNLTALQPVIVVEGKTTGSRTVPDRRIYRGLHAGFDRATLISGGGKKECVALARNLDAALREFSKGLKVVALLDRDMEVGHDSGLVELLPVSMVENFLLDPDVIFEAIESVREQVGLPTVDDITNTLDSLLAEQEPIEVGRRVAAALGPLHFHPPSLIENISAEAKAFAIRMGERYSVEQISEQRSIAERAVADITARRRRREEFDGKKVLTAFYASRLGESQLSRQVFAFYAAKAARRRKSVVDFFDKFFGERIEAEVTPKQS